MPGPVSVRGPHSPSAHGASDSRSSIQCSHCCRDATLARPSLSRYWATGAVRVPAALAKRAPRRASSSRALARRRTALACAGPSVRTAPWTVIESPRCPGRRVSYSTQRGSSFGASSPPPLVRRRLWQWFKYEHLDGEVGVDVVVAHKADYLAARQLFDLAAHVYLHDGLPAPAEIEHGLTLPGVGQRLFADREAVLEDDEH